MVPIELFVLIEFFLHGIQLGKLLLWVSKNMSRATWAALKSRPNNVLQVGHWNTVTRVAWPAVFSGFTGPWQQHGVFELPDKGEGGAQTDFGVAIVHANATRSTRVPTEYEIPRIFEVYPKQH